MDGGDRRLMPFCTKRCCESKIRNSQKMPDAGCRMPDAGCRIAAAPSAAYSSGQFSFISNTQIVKLFPTIQV
ncbi:hypothetical protein D0Z92_23100 [Salmonella enterica subsp. enterica serovar Newport]|uniref:Uncharacterized protein n=6 Tax=Salmonella enterica TaxID=28901 RepID=A0A3U4GZV4_SALET|nr:hypothetical protein [Salmonella enterica]EAA0985647.1 hypothetical protein [Salmonella enterica subsp. enterica serovar Bareilly]EAA1643110.1 hypothetical protein [Salmonella enterica subsp. enterica serovar Richmond]EAA5546853.1 hypothetical protein [Salmonella enterica subsp. enterica serovar Newport]EAA6683420.1 hypothetical protein [Salmonella enterica subsp. enterica serovar Mikawasima]EBS3704583.1 hypothetical protein [Salmonella enterica subsp. enterica serovar Putten]ECS9211798.1 